MRMALKNKQNLMYSNLGEARPLYVVEDGHVKMTEVDGEEVPVMAGYSNAIYEEPVPFIANIIPVGSESYARGNVAVPNAYGIDISAYDALILTKTHEFPITETSIIWHRSKPKYRTLDGGLLLDTDGVTIQDSETGELILACDTTVIDENSADYIVKRVATSMNVTLILLRRVNENASA